MLRVAAEPAGLSETARVALATGVLGGFTTYSAFNAELAAFARERGLPEPR